MGIDLIGRTALLVRRKLSAALHSTLRTRPGASFGCTELMALAIEGSGTGLWDRDAVTGDIRYSAEWKAILGYGPSELSTRIEDAYSRVHPDDLPYVTAAMQSHFEGRTQSYEVEHRLRCKDGTWKWVLSRGKVVARDRNGRALRMVGTTTDITATRTLAEKLQQTVDLIRNLTDQIPGFVFQCHIDPSGTARFSFASKGVADLYETTPSAVLERTGAVMDRVHPDDRDLVRASLFGPKRIEPWRIEYRVLLPTQGLRWHRAEGKPTHEADGSTTLHGLAVDITDQKRLEAELEKLALIDPLTQLPNRRFLREKMQAELSRIRRAASTQTAVMMLDIDRFKSINDRHGHAAGDAVLRHCAAVLSDEIRRQDAVGRIGGEEFVVLLSDSGISEAIALAARLRRRFAQKPVQADEEAIQFTASFGITVMTISDDRFEAALSRADIALYAAKRAGRDRIEICSPADAADYPLYRMLIEQEIEPMPRARHPAPADR